MTRREREGSVVFRPCFVAPPEGVQGFGRDRVGFGRLGLHDGGVLGVRQRALVIAEEQARVRAVRQRARIVGLERERRVAPVASFREASLVQVDVAEGSLDAVRPREMASRGQQQALRFG